LIALISAVAFSSSSVAADPPQFQVDPFWPKPLPNNWLLGQVASVAVGPDDHVWLLQRPRSLTDDEKGATLKPPRNKCCAPAPSVMEFDADGNFIQGWGFPQTTPWVANEHGIHVDRAGFVWIAGNNANDSAIFKYTKDGKPVLTIGKLGPSGGSNDTTLLGRPADIQVDDAAREVFVADGYGNRRVIVFDSETGAYKRHWGAYGGIPHDDKLPAYDPAASGSESFNTAVHCVRLARDGLLYVCDRSHNRVQVFQKNGTFVQEFFVERQTRSGQTVAEIAFSPDAAQTFMYVADGPNGEVQVLSRADGKPVGRFGRVGGMAGEFRSLHNIGADSKGNVYTAEAGLGRRVQKFTRVTE